ncbi:unnamed protein product [marine sediment metagenome]
MLTKKQKSKLDVMVAKYQARMEVTHRADRRTIRAWTQRYRITMERELMKQGKS